MNKEWEELIRYRFQKAIETKEEAKVLLQTGRLLGAEAKAIILIMLPLIKKP